MGSQQSTYADKKAQYDAARQRIFAADNQPGTSTSEKKFPEKPLVTRQPLGPTSGEGEAETVSGGSRGFAKRSRGRGRGAVKA